jgi:hypothetical protein
VTQRNASARTRRAVLGAAGRWAGLAGLAALAGGLLARARSREDCARQGACGNCPYVKRCRLPAARATRAAGEK